ncbi:GNAT family N-acetyltransferase [Cohnella sp. WQ 127256]|uniref:GNAT family N-acetyltransferase n=1 Tax=Cohnella sp. WQ 127256 TaxID=2938790 RepID=UPI0021181F3E|nr:GNAT family N-acetyltransferase [Cohnella sp. WQ 127256]
MLINLEARLDDSNIQEIVEYSVYSDSEKLVETIEAYKNDPELELYGYEVEGEVIGIIGVRLNVKKELQIEHIAITPDNRGLGYGRGIILEVIELKAPTLITAETDEDSVNFYRNIGFEIESLGEKYFGVERFKCVYPV